MRADIKGLQGIAMAVVVLYHYFPTTFKNGNLGMDQMFVIFGYQAAKKLENEINLLSPFGFYFGRLKRMLPVFFITSLICLIALLTNFPSGYLAINAASAINGLLFVTNIVNEQHDTNYTHEVTVANDLFLHTYSLGLQFQFCLIIPFVLSISNNLFKNTERYFFMFIVLASYALHMYCDAATAFNNLLCRLWQFFVGVFIYQETKYQREQLEQDLMEDRPVHNLNNNGRTEYVRYMHPTVTTISVEEDYMKTELIHLLTILCLVLSIFTQISKTELHVYGRFSTTIFAAVIIASGSFIELRLLKKKTLVKFGTYANSLYLVQWPVRVYLAYIDADSVFARVLGIAASFMFAVCLTEIYEKSIVKAERNTSIFILVGLFVVNLGLAIIAYTWEAMIAHRIDMQDAIVTAFKKAAEQFNTEP